MLTYENLHETTYQSISIFHRISFNDQHWVRIWYVMGIEYMQKLLTSIVLVISYWELAVWDLLSWKITISFTATKSDWFCVWIEYSHFCFFYPVQYQDQPLIMKTSVCLIKLCMRWNGQLYQFSIWLDAIINFCLDCVMYSELGNWKKYWVE